MADLFNQLSSHPRMIYLSVCFALLMISSSFLSPLFCSHWACAHAILILGRHIKGVPDPSSQIDWRGVNKRLWIECDKYISGIKDVLGRSIAYRYCNMLATRSALYCAKYLPISPSLCLHVEYCVTKQCKNSCRLQ